MAPVKLDMDFWLDGDAFVSTAYSGRLPVVEVVQRALIKIEGYQVAIKARQNPLSAMAQHLFGEEDFQERWKKAFQTQPGKKFYAALQAAKTSENFHQAALTYLAEIKNESRLSLMEVLIAEMLLCALDEAK